jgi:hypothetical protein
MQYIYWEKVRPYGTTFSYSGRTTPLAQYWVRMLHISVTSTILVTDVLVDWLDSIGHKFPIFLQQHIYIC